MLSPFVTLQQHGSGWKAKSSRRRKPYQPSAPSIKRLLALSNDDRYYAYHYIDDGAVGLEIGRAT